MKRKKGLRIAAFILVFCMVFHSGTIYAVESPAEWETIADALAEEQEQTQPDTAGETEPQGQAQLDTSEKTEPQEQTQLDTSEETEPQEQTQLDTSGETEPQEETQLDTAEETDPAQSETPASGETLPEETNGSDENVSETPETETGETDTEGTAAGESTEAGETASEQETTAGETLPATEPLPENTETESESETDDIAMMMGLDEIAPIAQDDGNVAQIENGDSYDSLQEAIDNVEEGGTITLLGNISGSYTSDGKSFTLDLDNKYTLSASGGTALTVAGGEVTVKNGTIDGGGSARALELKDGCTFTGTGLTVCNGQVSENGGGISATESCTVNLTDCHILSNTVDGSDNRGGGIYMKGGTLTISGTEIAANIAYHGSGLYLESVSVNGEALDIHGNTYNGNGSVGGVYLESVSGFIINSEVHENTMAHGSGFYISGGSFELGGVNIWGNTVYNSAGDSGVALSCEGGVKLTYKNGEIRGNNGQIYDNDDKCPGPGAIIFTKESGTEVRFENANISSNTDVEYTAWIKSSTTASFDQCNISGNTASKVGGIEVTGLNALVSFKNTVITGNTADSVIGGLYVGTRAGVKFEGDIAIYENTTNAQNSENDILIESNKPVIDLPAANSMKAEGKSFDHYVWKEGNEKYSESIQIPADNNKVRSFTAIEDKPRYVAQIGEVKYEELEKAVEAAAAGDTIVLIAGNDPGDPYGNSVVSNKITIDKSVTIYFSGQDISCTEGSDGNTLFEVTEGGSLKLTGEGKISGEVESKGTLTLEGKVSAEKYIHNGEKFTLSGPVGDITVELAEDKYLTATDKCEADSIKLIFDSEFVSDFNDETKDSTADRLLVEYAGNFDESKLVLEGIKPLISKLINDKEENKVKLQKSLLKGVFVGGTGAADTNPGTTTDQPVATLQEAVEALENSGQDTIWVLGEVEVSEPTAVEFAESDEKKQIRRHPSYDGVLFQVKSNIELSNVIVDGMRTYMETPTDTLFEGDAGSSISINSGAELCNNDLNKEQTEGLTEADKKKGGAIRSNGTVVLNGGKINNCNAYMGGGIYIHDGSFQMNSGTITGCTATGHMSYEGESQVAAGGGVCVEGVGMMTMEGGTIEYCSAGIGGGISLGGSYVLYPNAKDVETFVMTGGTVQNCIARTNGGGLYVQGSYKATIGTKTIVKSGGSCYIQGNKSQSGSFGGGGIYVNSGGSYENGRLQLYNAVIRNNTAGSPGGGLAGCSTSRTEIYLNDGGVFYQNKGFEKKDDILLSDSNGSTETSAPDSFVSEYMLGGAPYLWKHVGSGEDYGVNYLHDDDLVKHMYTDAADDSESIDNALALATVFIQNNSSVMRGGGIGSNGDVILGTAPTDTVDISVKKVWEDEGYGVPRPAKVAVWLLRSNEKNEEKEEKVGCVEIDSDDNVDNVWPVVSFTRQPRCDSAGNEYKYTISEEVERAGQSAAGRSIYTFTVEPADENQREYTVTNRINCGRLYIKKTADGIPTDLEEKFKIKVELTDDEGEAVPGPYTVRIGTDTNPSDETAQDVEFENGAAEITLEAGQYAYIDDIPENTNYKVTELDTEGYIVYAGDTENPDKEQLSLTGEIVAKQTKYAYFRNVYSHDSEITVTKYVTDNKGNGYPLKRSFWVALFADKDLTKQATEPEELVFDGTSWASVTFTGLLNNKTYYVGELDSKGNVINAGTNHLSDGSSFNVVFDGEEQNSVKAVHDQEGTISFKNVVTPKVVKSYLEIPITKDLTGRALIADKDVYTFTLTGLDQAPMPAKNSVTLTLSDAADSTFEDAFGAITFTRAGTYQYEIWEQAGEIGGITYDEKTVYRVTIQVETFDTIDNETVPISNVTSIELSKDGGTTFESLKEGVEGTAAFTNVYHAAPTEFAPQVKKTIIGDVPADNPKKFEFTIARDDAYEGVDMPDDPTLTITGAGTGSFDKITFTEAGTYKFRISEAAGDDAGYTYSKGYYTLTVVVTDDLDGKLAVTDKSYAYTGEDTTGTPSDCAEFTNRYTTTPVDFDLEVTKEITGEETPSDQTFDFKAELKDRNQEGVTFKQDTASVTGSGKAVFEDITFSKAGTYTLQVYEVQKSIPGYSFDGTNYDVEVVVTDEESRLTVSSVTYKKSGEPEDGTVDGITFTNTYSTTSVSYSPQIRKVITGDVPPANKEFRFEIRNGNPDGVTMPASGTAVVSGAGRGNFGAVTFTKAGTYTFEIREVKGAEHGYTYSDMVYTLTTEVTDENGVLKLSDIKYQAAGSEESSEELAGFSNSYAVVPTSYAPSVVKKISGEEPPADKTFEFKIAGKDGDPEGCAIADDTVTLTGPGNASFEPITFSRAGVYTLEISETAGSDKGYVYDTAVYTVEITVGDHDSRLQVDSVVYEADGEEADAAVFTNRYEAKCAVYRPQVRKVITGAEPRSGQKFEFTLTAKDTDGLIMPESTVAAVSGQGTAMFDAVTFTEPGTYSFEIREVNGGLPGYVYSEAVWTLTVQVADEDSVLTLQEITYQSGEEQRADAAEFVNEHRTGSLVVRKELVFEGHLLHALDQQFYVALYSDAECTDRVSDVKELVFEDETSEEVVFDGLDIGAVYYVSECGKDGTSLTSGYLADGTYFHAVFADGNEVRLEKDKEQAQKNFSNEFLHIPQRYYHQGELTVEKKLQDAEGNPKASNDIFYIGVFEDEAHTKLSDTVEPNILTLDMAGNSVATATVYTRSPDESGLKLYLAEVDANGVVVQGTKEFAYNVAMSADAPMLTLENDRETVAVTNQEKYEEPETESETEPAETEQPTEQTVTEDGTDAKKQTETETAGAVRTGDETNVRLYLMLLALSAGMTAAVFTGKRRKRKKG